MVCEKCKTQIPDDSKFCKECGVRITPLPKPAVAPATLRPPSKAPAPSPAPAPALAQKVSQPASAAPAPVATAVPKSPASLQTLQAASAPATKPATAPAPEADAKPKDTPAPASAPAAAEASQKDVKQLQTIIKYKVVLKVVSGGIAGKKYSVDEPTVINIGRGSNCMISIPKDVDPGVSRNHCRLDIVPPRTDLTDLGSSNGTYINDMRIEPNKKYELKSGDTFKVRENVFSIETKSTKVGADSAPAKE